MEERTREIIEDCLEELSSKKFIADALKVFDREIDFDDIAERRLFFDWLINDYILYDKDKKSSTTIIQKALEDSRNKYGSSQHYEKEIACLELWSLSAFRIYEIVDIKKGEEYSVIDIFDDPNHSFFLFDRSSSFTVNIHDLMYARLYKVGDIIRSAGGIVTAPRSFLSHIKDYIKSSSQKYYDSIHKTITKESEGDQTETAQSNEREGPRLNEYFRKESVAILKYLDFLNSDTNTTPTYVTAQGDPVVFSRSSFIISGRKDSFLSILDSCEEFIELENEDDPSILRYDWVEKLDSKDKTIVSSKHAPSSSSFPDKELNREADDTDYYNNKQQTVSMYRSEKQLLLLQTILWVQVDEDDIIVKYDGKKRSKNKVDKFTPYRVLGNLEIKGKILQVECLSETLLFRCNDLLESLAGDKYLMRLGNTYEEFITSAEEPPDQNSQDSVLSSSHETADYDLAEKYNIKDDSELMEEEDYYVDERMQKVVDESFNNLVQQHYENWINIKMSGLGDKTPLQMARTKKGKHDLRELLKEMQNNFSRNKENVKDLPPFPFEAIKKKLGL